MNNIRLGASTVISGAALGACTIGAAPGALLGGAGFLTAKVLTLTKLPNFINKSLKDYNTAIQVASFVSQVAAGCFLTASIAVATGLTATSIPITAGFLGATFVSALFFDIFILDACCPDDDD